VIAVIADRGAEASIALHKKHGFLEQGHLAKVGVRFGKPIGSYLFSLNLR
jgi:phosphinothricin acetyltransferase